MKQLSQHTFHIPVMGLGFTIDTPQKIAHMGISSVISVVEDELIEQIREFYCGIEGESYTAIRDNEPDKRSKRITAYLNLVNRIVKRKTNELRRQEFEKDTELTRYFELLPAESPTARLYQHMLQTAHPGIRKELQEYLRTKVVAGEIDVNIMAKVDRQHYTHDGTLIPEASDALTALRGFAQSNLESSVVFSAGYNPALYAYAANFPDFFPDTEGKLKKKIILKVSDFRSASTQGKLLAKKGLWVSEFRIESGLNCGGHAFATEGLLLGPILEEFKTGRKQLNAELLHLCNEALAAKDCNLLEPGRKIRVTVQGGIGTANENKFLLQHYDVSSTGWGSPFLLVPEATNVDDQTLQQLAHAQKEDYYLSNVSPLGVPFNYFRKSTSEQQRLKRIARGRPGSPCYKKFLVSNTEFTKEPICTASRQYQHLKLKELRSKNLPPAEYEKAYRHITAKDCLCEGLSSGVLIKNQLKPPHGLHATNICPGPNLVYFSGTFSLRQMVDHIYGRINLLNTRERSNMFVNELRLYAEYLNKEMNESLQVVNKRRIAYFNSFRTNLLSSIDYYKKLIPSLSLETGYYLEKMKSELNSIEIFLKNLSLPLEAQPAPVG